MRDRKRGKKRLKQGTNGQIKKKTTKAVDKKNYIRIELYIIVRRELFKHVWGRFMSPGHDPLCLRIGLRTKAERELF